MTTVDPVGLARAISAIRWALPNGWQVRLGMAWSMEHDCVMFTLWLDEHQQGWSTWLMEREGIDTIINLIAKAKAYVDECMASCIPDQGNVIPKPSKCHVTRGGDTERYPHPEGKDSAPERKVGWRQ